MKARLIQIVPITLTALAIAFRYASNWCIDVNGSCYGTWVHQIALSLTKPLYFFSLYFLPAAIVLIFVRRDIFSSWLNFAKYAFLFALIFVAGTHVTSGGAYMDFYPFYRDDAARVAGGVITALTLLFVAFKYLKHRK